MVTQHRHAHALLSLWPSHGAAPQEDYTAEHPVLPAEESLRTFGHILLIVPSPRNPANLGAGQMRELALPIVLQF